MYYHLCNGNNSPLCDTIEHPTAHDRVEQWCTNHSSQFFGSQLCNSCCCILHWVHQKCRFVLYSSNSTVTCMEQSHAFVLYVIASQVIVSMIVNANIDI